MMEDSEVVTLHNEGSNESIFTSNEHEGGKYLITNFNLKGHRETNGLMFISCKSDELKTNPKKIPDWFPVEFLNSHKVYAIKEEEPYLLKIFTRVHEATNKGIRSKGGRKIELLGEEVFGDILLGCGRCGYWSREGSNARRHLKNGVCLKEKSYSREDLVGLTKIERVRFLRKITSARARAKKKALKASMNQNNEENNTITETLSPQTTTTNNYSNNTEHYSNSNHNNTLPSSTFPYDNSNIYNHTSNTTISKKNTLSSQKPSVILNSSNTFNKNVARKVIKCRALRLGPLIQRDIITKTSYDIYTIQGEKDRIAWKPPRCHKWIEDSTQCQIVFKGARMKRRCLDLPIPIVLVYRKLDCKVHHCNFTLFHPSVRKAYKEDDNAKGTVNIKIYGDTVMTEDFYHYIISLLNVMKMKPCQTARHLTSVWEVILASRLHMAAIPDEYKKLITLSKQTVKSIWNNQDGLASSIRQQRSKRRKKVPRTLSSQEPVKQSTFNNNPAINLTTSSSNVNNNNNKSHELPHPCMKVPNHSHDKLPHTVVNSHKHSIIPPSQHTPMQPHHHPHPSNVPHPHWLGQNPHQYHNMTPYPMTTQHTDYYPMAGHFMTQYAPASLGTTTPI